MEREAQSGDTQSHLVDMADRALEAQMTPRFYAYSALVGTEVCRLRRKAHLSREALGTTSGVGDLRLELLERGLLTQAELEDEDIEALARILGVPPAYFWRQGAPAADPKPEGRSILAGLLEAVRGTWHATALPSPAFAMRGSPDPSQELAFALRKAPDESPVLEVTAHRELAGAIVRLVAKDGVETIAEIHLDEAGIGECPLPPEAVGDILIEWEDVLGDRTAHGGQSGE